MTRKAKIILFFLLLFFSLLYSFHLKQSLFFHPDFARDMHEILKITQGDIVLLGPKLTFGGLYLGPYYFYLFVPAYLIGGKKIIAVHYFNLLLFIVALGYFFKKSTEKFGLMKGFFSTVLIALLPLYLIGSRNPSNAYSFVPLFFILLTYLYFNQEKRPVPLFILGFIFGVIVNFHYLDIVFLPAMLIRLYSYQNNKKRLLLFLFGLGLSFLPIFLFELKHNFVMFTNTFINRSYLRWINKQNLPAGFEAKKNIMANIIFLSAQMKNYLSVNPLYLYLFSAFLFVFKKIKKRERLIFYSSLLTFFLVALIIRFQFIPHYLFGLSFFLIFTFLIIVLNLKPASLALLFMAGYIVLEIIVFPKNLYQRSWRSPERFEEAVSYAIREKLVKKTNFNVIQITKEKLLATLGFEYRYFLRKNGYIPDSEFLYSQSKELIVFSEIPYDDISQFNSWEVDQFGKQYFKKAKRYQVGTISIYKISK